MVEINVCNFCKSILFEEVFTVRDFRFRLPGDFMLVACKNCGLTFIKNPPSLSQLSSYYPSYYPDHLMTKPALRVKLIKIMKRITLSQFFGYGEKRFWKNIFYPFRRVFSHTPRYTKGGKILDVGCGRGDFLKSLKDLGWNVYGIDISENAVNAAKSSGLGNIFLFGDLRDAQFNNEMFDCVSFRHSLEHLFNPTETLTEAFRILKGGGTVLISVPNFGSLQSRIFGKYWFGVDAPRHLYHFSRPVIVRILEHTGFHVNEVTHTQVLAGIPASIKLRLGIPYDSLQWFDKLLISVCCVSFLGIGDSMTIIARKPTT